jgi:hypothetical protein
MFRKNTILLCATRTHAGSDVCSATAGSLPIGPFEDVRTIEEPPANVPVVVNGVRWFWWRRL